MLYDEALELDADPSQTGTARSRATANSPPQADHSGTEGDETDHGTSRFASSGCPWPVVEDHLRTSRAQHQTHHRVEDAHDNPGRVLLRLP